MDPGSSQECKVPDALLSFEVSKVQKEPQMPPNGTMHAEWVLSVGGRIVPLGTLLLGRAAKGPDVDPLGGTPLLALCCGAAAVQAGGICLPIRQQAAEKDNPHITLTSSFKTVQPQ